MDIPLYAAPLRGGTISALRVRHPIAWATTQPGSRRGKKVIKRTQSYTEFAQSFTEWR